MTATEALDVFARYCEKVYNMRSSGNAVNDRHLLNILHEQLPRQILNKLLLAFNEDGVGYLTFLMSNDTFHDFEFVLTPEGKLREEDVAHLCAVL